MVIGPELFAFMEVIAHGHEAAAALPASGMQDADTRWILSFAQAKAHQRPKRGSPELALDVLDVGVAR